MVATVQKFPLQCLEDTTKGVTASCGPELYWQLNLTSRIAPGFVWELPGSYLGVEVQFNCNIQIVVGIKRALRYLWGSL